MVKTTIRDYFQKKKIQTSAIADLISVLKNIP